MRVAYFGGGKREERGHWVSTANRSLTPSVTGNCATAQVKNAAINSRCRDRIFIALNSSIELSVFITLNRMYLIRLN